MKKYTYYIIALLTLFTSCGETEYEYSNYPCYLVFDNSLHQDATLSTAMNSMSPGVFCRIYISTRDGAEAFFFVNNQGLSSYKRPSALDLQRTRRLGVYNESGIIVGYGTLNSTFCVYDNQCRNCYDESGLPRYNLTIDSRGVAVCSNCKREYDLNNNGIVSGGTQGKGLIRYRGQTSGPLGVLNVSN